MFETCECERPQGNEPWTQMGQASDAFGERAGAEQAGLPLGQFLL